MIFKPCSNCRSISKWILKKEHLSFSWSPSASLGNPLIPISLVPLWSCSFLCKCFWILFTLILFQHTCSLSKLHGTATRESLVDTVLEGWVSSSCKGETNASMCGAAATPHRGWNAVMTVALGCCCTTKSTLGSISRRTKTEASYHPTAQKEQIHL